MSEISLHTPVRIEFSAELCSNYPTLPAWRLFDNLVAVRDFIKPYVFAATYRIRTQHDERGVVTSRALLAVADDGREFFIGGVIA